MTRPGAVLISLIGAFLLGCVVVFAIAVQPTNEAYFEPATPSRP